MSGLRLRSEGITWSDLGDEIVILDLRSSTYFSVRGSAAFLVTHLVRGAPTDVLIERVVGTYGTSPDRARTDVTAFLGELKSRDLVEQTHG